MNAEYTDAYVIDHLKHNNIGLNATDLVNLGRKKSVYENKKQAEENVAQLEEDLRSYSRMLYKKKENGNTDPQFTYPFKNLNNNFSDNFYSYKVRNNLYFQSFKKINDIFNEGSSVFLEGFFEKFFQDGDFIFIIEIDSFISWYTKNNILNEKIKKEENKINALSNLCKEYMKTLPESSTKYQIVKNAQTILDPAVNGDDKIQCGLSMMDDKAQQENEQESELLFARYQKRIQIFKDYLNDQQTPLASKSKSNLKVLSEGENSGFIIFLKGLVSLILAPTWLISDKPLKSLWKTPGERKIDEIKDILNDKQKNLKR